jgi:hypothetical protein
MNASTSNGTWRLAGYDTFSSEWYRLAGTYATERDARRAAAERLARIESHQPSGMSGGQDPDGIQDRVYIVAPDGMAYRFVD